MEAESYNQTRMASKSARKKISDTDSDDTYSTSQTSHSTSMSSKQPYAPIFLIIHSEEEGKYISSLSPFLIHKTIMGVAGEPKSIKNLRSGDILIRCAKEPHEKNLLKIKKFCDVKCTVTPHTSLNVSKGIVRCPALSKQTDEHILEFMKEQGVTVLQSYQQQLKLVSFRQKLTCTFLTHLGVINVKSLATMNTSVADKLYAPTVVCLNIAHLVSV